MTQVSYVKYGLAFPCLLAAFSLVQPLAKGEIVDMKLIGVGNGTVLGGVYVNPYTFSINGSTAQMLLACDDFTTDVYVGYDWLADARKLTDALTSGTEKFKNSGVVIPGSDGSLPSVATPHTVAEKYNAAGYLTQQLLGPASVGITGLQQSLLSYAIWQIFYPRSVKGWNNQGIGGAANVAAVGSLITHAFSVTATANYTPDYEVMLYTPTPAAISQEFIGVRPLLPVHSGFTSVPEASGVLFLGFNVLLLLMSYGFRRSSRAS